jgi:hypothetical protein
MNFNSLAIFVKKFGMLLKESLRIHSRQRVVCHWADNRVLIEFIGESSRNRIYITRAPPEGHQNSHKIPVTAVGLVERMKSSIHWGSAPRLRRVRCVAGTRSSRGRWDMSSYLSTEVNSTTKQLSRMARVLTIKRLGAIGLPIGLYKCQGAPCARMRTSRVYIEQCH